MGLEDLNLSEEDFGKIRQYLGIDELIEEIKGLREELSGRRPKDDRLPTEEHYRLLKEEYEKFRTEYDTAKGTVEFPAEFKKLAGKVDVLFQLVEDYKKAHEYLSGPRSDEFEDRLKKLYHGSLSHLVSTSASKISEVSAEAYDELRIDAAEFMRTQGAFGECMGSTYRISMLFDNHSEKMEFRAGPLEVHSIQLGTPNGDYDHITTARVVLMAAQRILDFYKEQKESAR